MKFSEVERLGDALIDELLSEVGLPHWKITIEYKNLEDGVVGYCSPEPDYELAQIQIDPHQIQSAEHYVEIIFHELLHITHSPYIIVETAILKGLDRDSGEYKAKYELLTSAAERTVKNLERLSYKQIQAFKKKAKKITKGFKNG